MRFAALALLGAMLLVGCSCEYYEEIVEAEVPVTGPWLGQEPPGATPSLFLATALIEGLRP
jgi:hypothetical protein